MEGTCVISESSICPEAASCLKSIYFATDLQFGQVSVEMFISVP